MTMERSRGNTLSVFTRLDIAALMADTCVHLGAASKAAMLGVARHRTAVKRLAGDACAGGPHATCHLWDLVYFESLTGCGSGSKL